jgi:hypothetical protein
VGLGLTTVAIAVVSMAIGGAGVGLWMRERARLDASRTIREPLYPTVNARGDPLLGVFGSRVPCGDCFAVKIALVLYHAADTKMPSTYKLLRVHVGRGNDRTVNEGTWAMTRGVAGYPNAVVYKLDANAPAEFRTYWAINDKLLLILDQYGNPRVGDEGFGFILNRTL